MRIEIPDVCACLVFRLRSRKQFNIIQSVLSFKTETEVKDIK